MRIQCRRQRSRAKDYAATTAVWRLRLHHVTFILVLLQIKTPCRPDDDRSMTFCISNYHTQLALRGLAASMYYYQ